MNKFLLFTVSGIVLLLVGISIFSQSSTKTDANVLGAQSAFVSLSPQQFNKELQTGKYTLIDIRTIDEYDAGHLNNASQIDYYQTRAFSEYLDTLDKDAQYLIYCRSGTRSANALTLMKQKGFTQVWDLAGGYNAWISTGLLLEK